MCGCEGYVCGCKGCVIVKVCVCVTLLDRGGAGCGEELCDRDCGRQKHYVRLRYAHGLPGWATISRLLLHFKVRGFHPCHRLRHHHPLVCHYHPSLCVSPFPSCKYLTYPQPAMTAGANPFSASVSRKAVVAQIVHNTWPIIWICTEKKILRAFFCTWNQSCQALWPILDMRGAPHRLSLFILCSLEICCDNSTIYVVGKVLSLRV